jgi:hypothetical protein
MAGSTSQIPVNPQGVRPVSIQDLARFRNTVPGQADTIVYPLFDYQAYPAAGALQLTFFATPQGQGATSAQNAAGTKTYADTNMQNAGLLAQGNRFFTTGIEVLFWPGNNPGFGATADASLGRNWNDVYAIMRSGWLNFRIQNRDYALDGPLQVFPPTSRLEGVGSVTSTLTAGAATAGEIDYATAAGFPYNIVPVMLQSNQFFVVTLNWPALVPTPSTTAARIGVRLRGQLIRDAQ